jgi:phosphatidylinositol-3,4,5-trisphosphate 3-phosphatase/dual-specificity protein phosphatase PTEN
MACSYVMTTDDLLPATKSKNTEEWTDDQVEALISAMPTDDPSVPLTQESYESTHTAERKRPDSGKPEGRKTASETLAHVLELHTSKRMKSPSPGEKGKQGVSIPSQRRWLHYWSLLLSHRAPQDFWAGEPHPKVRIISITLRTKEASAIKNQLIRAANAILDRTSEKRYKGKGEVWVSLARYDDELVDLLESWERQTRDEGGHMGLRRSGSGRRSNEAVADLFETQKWDEKKMVRSFARLGMTDGARREETELGKVTTYVMGPLTDEKWGEIKEVIAQEGNGLESPEVKSETASVNDVVTRMFSDGAEGIIVDANRELRVKLYIGQVWPFVLRFRSTAQAFCPIDFHGLALVYPCVPLRRGREEEEVEAHEERGGLPTWGGERYHRR